MIPFSSSKPTKPRLDTKKHALMSELRPYALVGTLRGKPAFSNGRYLLLGKPGPTVPTKPYTEENKKRSGKFDHLEPKGKQVEIFPLAAGKYVDTHVCPAVFLGEKGTTRPKFGRWVNRTFFDGIRTAFPTVRFFVLKRKLSDEYKEVGKWKIMLKTKDRKLVGFLMGLRGIGAPHPKIIAKNGRARR